MGAMDSKAFYDWMYNEWFKLLRNTYSQPSGDPSRWSRTEKTINIFFTEMNKKLFEELFKFRPAKSPLQVLKSPCARYLPEFHPYSVFSTPLLLLLL